MSKAAGALWPLEARCTDATELDDDLTQMMVSLVKQPGGNINDDHNRNSHILFISHHCDGTVEL